MYYPIGRYNRTGDTDNRSGDPNARGAGLERQSRNGEYNEAGFVDHQHAGCARLLNRRDHDDQLGCRVGERAAPRHAVRRLRGNGSRL
jgi:hypothetical protein